MIQIDMKMPEACGECPFSDDSRDYPYCWVLHQNRGYKFDRRTKRFPNCPLKPVQEKNVEDETSKLRNLCRVLFNRCRAAGSFGGAMCVYCGMRNECETMHST